MYKQFRFWKNALALPLTIIAIWLMRGEPDASPRWYAGIGIVVLFGFTYVAEEVVWIIQRKGRPCKECGQRVHLRPFSLRISCPHCGQALE